MHLTVGETAPILTRVQEEWFDEIRWTLETAYLAATDPRGQSGFRGDVARWERARRVIISAIDRDGAFLDVGCANGHLMETLTAWAALDGHRIEPYGLDISERLAELARSRLPRWADRIFVGNVLGWNPPRRFDFVRTELVYVPDERRKELIERLLGGCLSTGGRLIVCSYGSASAGRPRVAKIADVLRQLGYQPDGEAAAADSNGVVFTRVAWLSAPP